MENREIFAVRGNNTLKGTVDVSGAKNSALKLMAASILAQGECVIRNVPDISDIDVMAGVLSGMGAKVIRDDHPHRDEHTLTIDSSYLDSWEAPYEFVSKMRASIAVLGPLLGRFGKARIAMPGGCQIGARSINLHLKGLAALGVEFDAEYGYLNASAPEGLKGARVVFDFPSVGATENVLMAAAAAKGTTTIENAAREPEITDLARMLEEMGAHIEGAGESTITVEGVPLGSLRPCDHATVGDRIEAGTFLTGAALTGGPVTVRGVNPAHLRLVLFKLEEMGCWVDIASDSITVGRDGPLLPVKIQTLPFPGFPTDLQAQFMLLAACADGVSFITENIFENRFMFASELARMGADISIEDHHALVRGSSAGLQGAPVSATDLRAGAALVLAGIVADSETHVCDIHHIDRGYEDYAGKLCSLGADVRRQSIPGDDYSDIP